MIKAPSQEMFAILTLMSSINPQLYLASTSPRRRELLTSLGLQFDILPIDVEESRLPTESPQDYVCRVALDKARAGWSHKQRNQILPVLGSDTEVVRNDHVFGKPADREDAFRMLSLLSGQQHQVMSAVAVVEGDREKVLLNTSLVQFRSITTDEMQWYWQTGEPLGKAGGYAIQGKAALFINDLQGSFSAVMGLPLFETGELLAEFGVLSLSP